MSAPLQTTQPRKMWRRIIKIILLSVLVIAGLYGGLTIYYCYVGERARATWKTATLPQLAELSSTNTEIQTELNYLKNPTPNVNLGWAGLDHVLLMTNGEYLIYAWHHGLNSGLVKHLFLAHGTDGKWYYSTYHFCNHMGTIRGDDPPGSIAEFAKRYSVREFDGKSDECLKKTWPP